MPKKSVVRLLAEEAEQVVESVFRPETRARATARRVASTSTSTKERNKNNDNAVLMDNIEAKAIMVSLTENEKEIKNEQPVVAGPAEEFRASMRAHIELSEADLAR